MLFLTKPMAALLMVMPIAVCDCHSGEWFYAQDILVSTDYLSVKALDVHVKNGVANIGNFKVESAKGLKVSDVRFTTFHNHNGISGFQDPPDIATSVSSATSNPPSSTIEIRDINNNSLGNGHGESWEVIITLTPGDGEPSVFSGTR